MCRRVIPEQIRLPVPIDVVVNIQSRRITAYRRWFELRDQCRSVVHAMRVVGRRR